MSEYQSDLPPASIPPTSKSPVSTEDTPPQGPPKGIITGPLDASENARAIVRLVQCKLCSMPLRKPITLPCGNSLCRQCIPELHPRSNISYPGTEVRSKGFACPFVEECGVEHSAADCSLDVVLTKVMAIVKADMENYRPMVGETPILLEEQDQWQIAGLPCLREKGPRSKVLHGGRLVATYTMAELGELKHDSEVTYTVLSDHSDGYRSLDVAVLEHMKEDTRSELDCQVCYALFLDPLTTSCGHTFCRRCLQRVSDHSTCCPICRRDQAIPTASSMAAYPSNKTLVSLLMGFCPDAVAVRADTIRQENANRMGELDTPLFVCTPAFPNMPTFLHIFEPRYRLMIRRAMESGEGKFGMILPNIHQTPQGDLGKVSFLQYGCMLHIRNMQLLADGRSLLETIGMHRFKVVKHGVLDGYIVGKVERVDDISLADEEALEAFETTHPNTRALSAADQFGAPPNHFPAGIATGTGRRPSTILDLDTASTKDLMDIAIRFVRTMQSASAPWLQRRHREIHGECPTDPLQFPWWFASILPIQNEEKYKLFPTTSVRARLKICVGWIMRIEAQRW
jgi:hypothetical protein